MSEELTALKLVEDIQNLLLKNEKVSLNATLKIKIGSFMTHAESIGYGLNNETGESSIVIEVCESCLKREMSKVMLTNLTKLLGRIKTNESKQEESNA